jgi:uncharacterized membrane protein
MKKNKNKKWTIIGGIIGGIWGITNFSPLTVALIRYNQIIGDLYSIPITVSGRLSERIFQIHPDSYFTIFLMPTIIGVIIGLLLAGGITKIFSR